MTRLALICVAASALLAAGCGDDNSGSASSQGEKTMMTSTTGDAMAKSDTTMEKDDAIEKTDTTMEKQDAMEKDDAMEKTNTMEKDDTAMTTVKDDSKMMAKKTGSTLKVVGSRYGKVVADAKGEALYLFTKERSSKSECYGACARAWPPMLTKGKPRAGSGVKASLLGTTKRKDGKLQVTYGGRPLYYYVDDAPGKILCQNVAEFGGKWLVVAPSGKAIR